MQSGFCAQGVTVPWKKSTATIKQTEAAEASDPDQPDRCGGSFPASKAALAETWPKLDGA
jgi:hypothetical protein